jgi:hypothetical protein
MRKKSILTFGRQKTNLLSHLRSATTINRRSRDTRKRGRDVNASRGDGRKIGRGGTVEKIIDKGSSNFFFPSCLWFFWGTYLKRRRANDDENSRADVAWFFFFFSFLL